jgi:hypothetical protein
VALRKKWPLGGYPGPARIVLGTLRYLPEHGKPELVSHAGLRYQTEFLATLDRPTGQGRKGRSTGSARVFPGRLRNYQAAPDPEEWCRTFRCHRGWAEAPSDDCCKAGAIFPLAPELLGSSIDDLHARTQSELFDCPSQEVSRAVRGIEQDETKVPVLDRKHEAGQATP